MTNTPINADNTNDPQDNPLLTAYALGELELGSPEHDEVEQMLQAHPHLRDQVQEIADLGNQLTQSYEQAADPGLEPDALDDLSQAIDTPAAPTHYRPGALRRLLPYAGVAACTALATAGVFLASGPNTPATNVASIDSDANDFEEPVVPMARLSETPVSPNALRDLGRTPSETTTRRPTADNTSHAQGLTGPLVTFAIPPFENAPSYDLRGALGVANGTPPPTAPVLTIRASDQLAESRLTYENLLLYPGEWPELTEQRLRREADRSGNVAEGPGGGGGGGEGRGGLFGVDENGDQLRPAPTPEIEQIQQALRQLGQAALGEHENQELSEQIAANVAHAIEREMIEVERRQIWREQERQRRERFALINDNPFRLATLEPLSTFSVDVDNASYTYSRRAILDDRQLPVPDAVRIEEWVNYFDYGYTAPVVDPALLDNGRLTTAALQRLEVADRSFVPFASDVEVTDCPWADGHQLVRIGVQAMDVQREDRPPTHLVFLLDVSGSMNSPDKLGLVQTAMPLLLDQLNDNDRVSIVVYAGASGLILEAEPAGNHERIRLAIQQLRAGGSTAGGQGIQLAYDIAQEHYIPGGINRVILCTDGDFNVGTSDTGQLVRLVSERANPAADDGEAPQGVYLSVMGFGTGNLNDEMLERITNAGNGNYNYIDSVTEAVRTLSNQAGGTLVTVAKDVKIQIEFNPALVASYRLIGYENRILSAQDFNNDTVDAGDIGAGHNVTALYEIVPINPTPGLAGDAPSTIDELRYQLPRGLTELAQADELLTLKIRYKPVDAAAEQGTSRLVEQHIPAGAVAFDQASEPTRFAASVAAMGMVLRGSPYLGTANTQWVIDTARASRSYDPNGLRDQFVQLATRAQRIQLGQADPQPDDAALIEHRRRNERD